MKDRFDGIGKRIMEVWEKDGEDCVKLKYKNNAWEIVTIRFYRMPHIQDHLSFCCLYVTVQNNFELSFYTLREFEGVYSLEAEKGRSRETMKNLSIDQVMQSLDKFENRLKEYETEQFDRMQQYAQNDSEDADKVLDSLA